MLFAEMEDESFQQEFRLLLRDYVGRPSPLYYARRLSEHVPGFISSARI